MSDVRKRQSKCVKTFITNSGEETARAGGDVKAIKFFFPERDETQVMNLSDLSDEMVAAAAAFGISTSVSNTFGAADMSVDDAIEAAAARWETLVGGTWSGERETGPRTSLLLEAAKLLRSKSGIAPDKNWEEAFTAKITSGEVTAKNLLAKPQFAAAYEEIKSQRQEERRKRAAEKAGTDTDISFLE